MIKKPMINLTRLKELMEKRGMTMVDLAKEAEVSYDTIFSIHSGRRPNTSSATLRKLAKALRVSVNDLLEGGGEDVIENELPQIVRQLAEIATELSETRQEELVRIADAFKKLESEEGYLPFDRKKMLALLHAAETLGPGDGTADLILAMRQELGLVNLSARWLIDLGDTPQHGSQNPTEAK
jgi:transcriptional regulator with XRE-family HTH domain